MIKKVLFILSLLLFFACNTLTIPESQPGYVDVSNSINNFNLDFKDDEFNDILNRVLTLSLNQEWETVFSLLDESLAKADETHKKVYLSYLSKMIFIPTLKVRAAELILKYKDTNTEFYKDLIDLEKELPSRIEWGEDMVTLPLIGDYPCVEVEVDGVVMKMALDTGAQSTFLFSDAAERVNLKGVELGDITLRDSNNKTSTSSWVLAESIKLGALELKNEKIITSKRPFAWYGFDGLIGWPVISQLKLIIDKKSNTLSFIKPTDRVVTESNFMWIGDPVVLTHIQKNPELFVLDTGADRTYFKSRVLAEYNINTKKALWSINMGLNGREIARRDKIEELTMILDNKLITYSDYINIPISNAMFNFMSGVLGADIIHEGVLNLDYPRGRILYSPNQ